MRMTRAGNALVMSKTWCASSFLPRNPLLAEARRADLGGTYQDIGHADAAGCPCHLQPLQ